jgi:hypothetical protein
MLDLGVFGAANMTAKLSASFHYIFEVSDLFQATPAIFILGKNTVIETSFFYYLLMLNFSLLILLIFERRKL